MQQFSIGQRWVSAGEIHLGIGMVLAVELRTVSIIFPATGETRVYAKDSAPLSRVQFAPGDVITDQNGCPLDVIEVEDQNGLLVYHCINEAAQPVRLSEGKLNNFLSLNQPLQRLLNGQIDRNKWFELRARTQKNLSLLGQSPLQGLTGCRTSLIDHQLYIAHEVASRFAPRVLLADEVGLGKTIEAGLIVHQQLLKERAQRVLIVVPETLLHQWLLEMMRRFNLLFSVFDAARCDAMEVQGENGLSAQDNPFHSEQLVLCSLQFLTEHESRFKQSLQGDWDMLVVDEAHHLVWSEENPSIEYQRIEALAQCVPSVLLLTATPEQLGKESHFARLRLLDPDRFSDLQHFIEDEAHYQEFADIVQVLLEDTSLDAAQYQLLQQTLDEGDNQYPLEHLEDTDPTLRHQSRERLVDHLLDRHGTGRLLFRNTRHAVQGFPQRQLHPYPLECPAVYDELYQGLRDEVEINTQWLLSPEIVLTALTGQAQRWGEVDPRVQWLADFLKARKGDKVLIICASAETAVDLVQLVKARIGVTIGAFHEGLSLLERDRAAAWFADFENGAQALVCSEIGSEGRNFQFAHHLVLFDLPYNPDLLEQRIGRLDRIGQTQTIHLHVPYLQHTAQQFMLDWLHHSLNAFEQTCPAGHSVYMQVCKSLQACLHSLPEDVSEFLEHSRLLHEQLNRQMQQGRDRLLEYNSCRPAMARGLREQAESLHLGLDLPRYMESLYDAYGISLDIRSPGCYVLHPTDNMPQPVPGLPEDGMTITYDRAIALANEDVRFLTWEHPFVRTLMDMVQSSEFGNTALLAVKYRAVTAGTLLVDCFFRIEIPDKQGSEAQRYLVDNLFRVCLDEQGVEHQSKLSPDVIHRTMQLVDTDTSIKVVKSRESVIKALLERAEHSARDCLPGRLNEAHTAANDLLEEEGNRLIALQTINPNVRDEEIAYFRDLQRRVNEQIESANIRLDALRVLVAI